MKHLFILIALCFLLATSTSAQHLPDFGQFMKETQVSQNVPGKVSMAWWIPVEFWEITFRREESMTDEQRTEFVETLRPYTLFAVVDGKVGAFGGVTYTPEETISRTLVFIDREDNEYKPLAKEEINPDVRNLLDVMKPILVNMMGQMGQNLNFYVFADADEQTERIADPYTEGKVRLAFQNVEYQWRTPLSSLLAPKQCPVDEELMSGAWKYCPYHGKELVEQETE